MNSKFLVKIFPFLHWLPLSKKYWKDDVIAGINSTLVVIPQAVAFALIAGLPVEYGFYTAIITPIIAALFGSSYHLVSGPTTASSVVTFATVSAIIPPQNDIQSYILLTLVLACISGFIKLILGILKAGKWVNYVSHSVIIGFTAGVGILITVKQFQHILGLDIPQHFTVQETLQYLTYHLKETDFMTLGLALFTIILAIVIKNKIRFLSKYYLIITLILSSLLSFFIDHIQTLSGIDSKIPPFSLPNLTFENIRLLGSGAFVLALLGLIEAIAIAKYVAIHAQQRIDVNQEFIGQGLSNIIGSFWGAYPSSGSFTRSELNYKAGAKTPLAAILSGVFLFIIFLFFGKFISYLPKAAMGAIILIVAYNLINVNYIKKAVHASKTEILVLAITFLSTLFFAMQMALLIGIITSLFFYLERSSHPNIAVLGLNAHKKFVNIIRDTKAKECSSVKIIRIDGALFFASIDSVADFFDTLWTNPSISNVLVVSDGINFVDFDAAQWLTNEVLKWRKAGKNIYFSGMKIVAQEVLRKGGFYTQIGEHYFFSNKDQAIFTIHQNLSTPCSEVVFTDCKTEMTQT